MSEHQEKKVKDNGDHPDTQYPNTKEQGPPHEGGAEPTGFLEGPGDEMEQLRQKLEEARKSAEFYKDQLLRKAAEFENYKRRSDAERVELILNANEDLISSLLPILNDFLRSLKSGAEKKDFDAFTKGVELISNKLSMLLESYGLTPFESVGKPFDVGFHDALLQVPRNDVPPNTVVEEIEPGYKLKDRVLRHAKVIVSSAVPSSESPMESGNSV